MNRYLLDTNICIYFLKGLYELDKKIADIGQHSCYISEITVVELKYGVENSKTAETMRAIIEAFIPKFAVVPIYVDEKVVGSTSFDDCVHIATATISKVDLLVSWNFKHIVNIFRIRGYNSVNLRQGYSLLEIRSPKDIVGYENEG